MKAVRAAAARPRCDGDGPDRVLAFDAEECRFPVCRLFTSWLGNDATFPRRSRALQTPENSATEAPDPDIPERQACEGAPMRSTPRLLLQASLLTLGVAGAFAVAAQAPK